MNTKQPSFVVTTSYERLKTPPKRNELGPCFVSTKHDAHTHERKAADIQNKL